MIMDKDDGVLQPSEHEQFQGNADIIVLHKAIEDFNKDGDSYARLTWIINSSGNANAG